MVTQRSAQVYVANSTDGHATITLYHNNSSNGTQSGTWQAAPGQQVGPLTVSFETGWGSWGILDYWAVELAVSGGSTPGVYESSGIFPYSDWKECQLQSADAGQNLHVTVDTHTFAINLPSGGCEAPMTYAGPYAKVDHVFVLMLENHSFDNIFALSGIPGIIHATASDANSYNGTTYPVASPAPESMPTDPGHEFADVVEQLCGQGAAHTPWQPYPQPITNAGFVANYATTRSEIAPHNPNLPSPSAYGDVMKCFATPTQLPVIYQLATQFALCDQWFSSIPGPTWPNRFLVHGASSGGWADGPTSENILEWETVSGFTYPSGSSIYGALSRAEMQWRIYVDESGPVDMVPELGTT